MSGFYIICGLIVLGLLGYLLIVLFKPEWF